MSETAPQKLQTNEKHSWQVYIHEDNILKIRCGAIVKKKTIVLWRWVVGLTKQIQDIDGPGMPES